MKKRIIYYQKLLKKSELYPVHTKKDIEALKIAMQYKTNFSIRSIIFQKKRQEAKEKTIK